jgi:aspartate/methionine/tyrosine aminotransferase
MKIKRYYMEDWLNDSRQIKYNLTASGCQDFHLKELFKLCNTKLDMLNNIFLGDNDTRGSLKLRKEICKSYQKLPLKNIIVTNGSSEAIFAFFNELLKKDDEVVIPFPAFQCLYQIPISIGCKVKYLDLLKCKDYRLDLKKLDKLVTKKTKLIIINNPHNPFGWTLNKKELLEIGKIAKKNDCYLFFDEHYRFLPIEKGTKLIPSGYNICKKIHKKVFATGSMIKCFGIVGIRIGWLIGEPNILAKCRDYKDYLTHTTPEITDFIAYTALKNKNKIIKIKKKDILTNIKVLNKFMEKNKNMFDYIAPTGGVVCFPKLRIKKDSKIFCKDLLQKTGVSILPGFAFEIKEHFRLNIGINSDKFKKALDLMQKYIDKNYN